MKSSFVVIALALVLLAPRLNAWSVEGHEITADVAQLKIQNDANVTKAITKILTPDAAPNSETPHLADYVVWADDIRAKETGQQVQKGKPHFFALPTADAEYEKFKEVAEFKGNESWHFVNLPVSATKYSKVPGSKLDVVEAITRCVSILETSNDAFKQKWALIFLIHLVGDLHQPLHTIDGDFDVSDTAHPKFHDHFVAGDVDDGGANGLVIPPVGTEPLTLHHFWDQNIVQAIGTTPADAETKLPTLSDPNTGDSKQWPAQWVVYSLAGAKKAYSNLSYSDATQNGTHWRILVTLPNGKAGYAQDMKATAEEQLARAGMDLADLLKSIHWAALR